MKLLNSFSHSKSLNINLLQDINRYYINNLVNILALYEYNLILNEDDARCYYTEVDNFNKIKSIIFFTISSEPCFWTSINNSSIFTP